MNSNIVNHLHPNDGDLQRANLIATINRHPFSGSLAPITQSDYLDSTTHPAIELGPPRQKRKLEYVKCDFCRRDKKKCEPSERQWPGEKCQRCDAKGLTCSAPAKKNKADSDALAVDNISLLASSAQDLLHEERAYCALAEKCIQQMSSGLRRNICNISTEDTEVGAIHRSHIDHMVHEELRYACRYWVPHLCRGKYKFLGDEVLQDQVYNFLTGHFLCWLEALSLLGRLQDGINSLESLVSLVDYAMCSAKLRGFVLDANRFILDYGADIEQFPLSIYPNALHCVQSGSMKEIHIPGLPASRDLHMDDDLASSLPLAESDRIELINEIKGVSHDPFIVLTRPCLRLESINHCDVDTVARESLTESYDLPFSHAAVYDSRWSLPRLLDATLNLKNNLMHRLDEVGARSSFSLWDDLSDEHKLTQTIFPLARTYIYCAPCVCSIQTAIHVCNRVSSTIHEYFIRPDDRLTSSCYSGQNGLARLRSIYGAVRYHEENAKAPLDHKVPAGTRYIDMVWLEKRFDRIEYEGESLEHLYQSSSEISRAVLLGELEHLRPITQQMTCARVPKQAEIWQLHLSRNAQRWSQEYIGQFATRFPVLPTEHPQFSANSVGMEQSTTTATSSPSPLPSGMQNSHSD
ncbi:hypothetical protein V500_03065 [Pseudogymnoascus sp. VKM F-4518 (FW-2643)]|nr:hypothetical protein V500_03065 [Pseudogymnoascus sp. VKM F-4518 (FW-2643)]